jgi:ATP-dependent RNA helicase DDX18/HAS1
LEALDRQSDDDDEDRKRRDPPEVSQAIHALVPWEEVDEGFKKTDESSSTAELSDPPSDESDVEPCEEHYRIPPAKEEPVVLEQQIVCRSDPPDDAAAAVHKSKEELIHRINTQLALVPSPSQYNGYRHHFITVKEQHRFLLLYNFLKRNLQSKIILYFSTTKSTQYHAKLLHQLQFEVKYVHNGQSKEKFLDTYLSFSKQKRGILCLPDFQGKELAVPSTVSWIVQYEPPQDPTEYIFRIGRISAERSSSGNKALLFLTPDQSRFLTYFKAARVKIYEYEMHNLNNVQRHYEKLVKREERLNTMGREAYHSYLLDYASHEYRDVYDVHGLCKDLVAKSFGFDKAPSSSGEREGSRKVSHREENRWKPNKKENGDQWLNREERSWKHASRHEHLMKKERIRS